MTTKTKLIVAGISALILLGAGFFAGRVTLNEKTTTVTKIEYLKGDSIPYPVPYPEYRDSIVYKDKLVLRDTTIYVPIPQDVDTMAILAEYFTAHNYRYDFGSDTTGLATVKFLVTQNQVFDFTGTLVPVVKQVSTTITKYNVPLFSWYAMVGTNLYPLSGSGSLVKASVGASIKQRYILGISGYRLPDQSLSAGIDFGIQF